MSILIKIGMVLLLIGAAFAYVNHRDHIIDARGYNRANSEWGQFNDRQRSAQLTAQLKANKDALEHEHRVLELAAQTEADHQKEMEHANEKISMLSAAVADGRVRLSIAVGPGRAKAGDSTKTDPRPSSTPDGVQRADIMPDAANRIISISANGDRLVSERNECIRLYNQVKTEYNRKD